MCEAARERGVKVILSGMGADELFGGYRKHLACLAGQQVPAGSRPASGAPSSSQRWTGCLSAWRAVACGTRGGRSASSPSPSCQRNRGSAAATPCTTRLSSPVCSARISPATSARSSRSTAEIYDDNALADEVNRMCLADSRMFLPGLNLAYTDRASMAASVEVRVPFVDPMVAQAAFSIPGSAKIRRPPGQGRAQAGGRELAARGDRAPAQGLLQRTAARLGAATTCGGHPATCSSAVNW